MIKRTGKSRLAIAVGGAVALALLVSACSSSKKSDTGGSSAAASSGGSSSASAAAAKFKVDTSQCTDPKAAAAPITDTWKVGYSAPLSGPVAGVVTYALEGYKARIAAFNAAGGANGVKISVDYKDDQYTPDKAKANVTQFLQSEKVDSLATFGSGPVGAIADDQNAACVPLLYPSSSVQTVPRHQPVPVDRAVPAGR